MTAQAPERIMLDGRPHALYAAPLDLLADTHELCLGNPNYSSTANYRGYIGTWEVRDRQLYLVQLCWDDGWRNGEIAIDDDTRTSLFHAVPCEDFPIPARWFSGALRISLGRRLIYSHHGWSHWFERERVLHVRKGEVVRDREVDTKAILERWLQRNPQASGWLDHSSAPPGGGPLIWFDDDDDDDWTADWWPPGYMQLPPDGV